MELEGLKCGLRNLATNHMKVTDLMTDRHVQVRKFMREETEEVVGPSCSDGAKSNEQVFYMQCICIL
ncbi:hypothetical protein DPMN_009437 [Dreissena polymorpha]|uniref:Uncharacterized protein n=1 Tax=Dreissena polymorpha TaxID=45954 RepID=A0A9D4N032_DREPO|nr:hypothetical protein DPMN_009437 [Dreissena polymorpha]